MPRIIDVNASIPARFTTVDVVARLVGPSDGRHSPVPSLGSDSEDEPANVAYLRATAGCRCAAAFFRLTSLHWRDHTWSTSYSGTHDMHVPHAQVERIERLPAASDFRCCHCRGHRPIHAAGVSTVACCGGFGGRDGDGDRESDGDGGAGEAAASSAVASPVCYRLAVYSYRRMATLPEWRAGPTSALVGTITTSATSTVPARAAGTTTTTTAPEGRASTCTINVHGTAAYIKRLESVCLFGGALSPHCHPCSGVRLLHPERRLGWRRTRAHRAP